MQAYDAEFYPIRDENKKNSVYKLLGIGICIILIILLVLRIYGWNHDRQETRLLVLINEWNSLEHSEFSPRLTEIQGGFRLDKQCVRDFEHMMADCGSAGCEPRLTAAYRDTEEQQRVFSAKERELQAADMDKALAPMYESRPGRSEHQLGLAVDIIDAAADSTDESSGTAEWLMENSWRYGFILRYPEGRENTTGMYFNPRHYRYVGQTAAKQIYDMGICLEDYIELFYSEEAVIKFED